MRLRCFAVDQDGLLQAVSPRSIDLVWTGQISMGQLGLGCPPEPLQVITFLCTNDLHPKVTYFLRLDSLDGWVNQDIRDRVSSAVRAFNSVELDDPAVLVQLSDWPTDWKSQSAIALDVLPDCFTNYGLGSPTVLSEALEIPLSVLFREFSSSFESAP